jgi:hypothetical protein
VIVGVSGGVGGVSRSSAEHLAPRMSSASTTAELPTGSPAASRIDAYEAADRDGEASVRMRLIGGGRRT